MAYVLVANGVIFEIVDETHKSPFSAWCATEGAQIGWTYNPGDQTASPPRPEPAPTPEETRGVFLAAVQARLDAFAATRSYDGIVAAATYAASADPKFRAEGQYAVEARDATWAKGYEILNNVSSGRRSMPAIEEALAELPPLAWPDEA